MLHLTVKTDGPWEGGLKVEGKIWADGNSQAGVFLKQLKGKKDVRP